jgi:mercuric ion transport protein
VPQGVGWRHVLTSATPVAVVGTLVCCALPLALLALGLGSVLVSLLGAAPWMIVLQRHKAWMFVFAGLMLVSNYWTLFRSHDACAPDAVCHASRPVGGWARRLYWSSVLAYALGLIIAYLSLPIARALGYTTL